MRNGTREMRYSLIGREVTHDAACEHLSASGLEGIIAVVACDKPPVGTLAASALAWSLSQPPEYLLRQYTSGQGWYAQAPPEVGAPGTASPPGSMR